MTWQATGGAGAGKYLPPEPPLCWLCSCSKIVDGLFIFSFICKNMVHAQRKKNGNAVRYTLPKIEKKPTPQLFVLF